MSSNEEILDNICASIRESCNTYIGFRNHEDGISELKTSLNNILKKYPENIVCDLKFKVVPAEQDNCVFVNLYYKDYEIINSNLFTLKDVIDKIGLGLYEIKDNQIILDMKSIFVFKLNIEEE